MTDRISFPPLLDLSSGELRMERERLLSAITQRAMPRSPLSQRFGRRAVLAGGMAVAVAATAIAVPLVLGNSGSRVPVRRAPGAEPVEPGGISVSTIDEANAHLPFNAVLPSDATPIAGIQVSSAGKPSDSSGAVQANFDTDAGNYMLSEYTSDATVETLQQWATEECEGCTTQEVVTEDGVHVLVLESSVFGLRLQWIRGDGASPVMTELDWSRDMPANNVVPSQQSALAIVGDIIHQGG
jgi:hypothetical protein